MKFHFGTSSWGSTRKLPRALTEDKATREALRRHERTGRPLGSEKFIAKLERIAGRLLRRQKPGPKTREARKR